MTSSDPDTPPAADPAVRRGRGRPRRAETDQAIHRAALRLLRDAGPSAVTVEAVAAASGVAKATIYRRHPDRDSVLRAALEEVIRPPREAPGESTRDRIRWALDAAWHQVSDVLGPGGVSALLADDPSEFNDLFRRVLDPYTEALVELIQADMADGRLRSDLDADTVVSLLFGAYLGELIRRGQVDGDFSERCVDLIWVAIRAEPSGQG